MLEQSPLYLVGTTREDGAGLPADGYARIRGVGALCVTYRVGGLNTVNVVACPYAERSPVVVLTGSPGLEDHPFYVGVYGGLIGREAVPRSCTTPIAC